ncbi:MAG: hypothetical protein WAV41_02225 [Microgenomates group bacterium]
MSKTLRIMEDVGKRSARVTDVRVARRAEAETVEASLVEARLLKKRFSTDTALYIEAEGEPATIVGKQYADKLRAALWAYANR